MHPNALCVIGLSPNRFGSISASTQYGLENPKLLHLLSLSTYPCFSFKFTNVKLKITLINSFKSNQVGKQQTLNNKPDH